MSASGTPIFKTVTADDVGVTLDFGQQVTAFVLRNDGPNTVFFAEGAVAPTPTRGNGRYGLNPGEVLPLSKVALQKLSFICAADETAVVQATGVPNGSVDMDPDAEYNLIDLSSFGAVAADDVAGPLALNIPLAAFADYDLAFLSEDVETDHMSVGQGDTSDVGYVTALLEAELDSSGSYEEIMSFKLAIGGGGSGAGGAGATFSNRKTLTLNDLKAVGAVITNIRSTVAVTQTAGVGAMTGAIDFTNFALVLYKGTRGADYA